LCFAILAGCSKPEPTAPEAKPTEPVVYFKVDPQTAGTLIGHIRYTGPKPALKMIDMDSDAECAKLHKGGRVKDESMIVGRSGEFANVFVYVKSGLEGKNFEPPQTPVTIDQKGCWFHPRVLGIQVGQTLEVTNSDPVTHNIHPQPQSNREWNQSQSAGDPPLKRKFVRPEILVPVKCNVHRWMRALIGVTDHPYFAVTKEDGSFEIKNVPPGTYTIAAVHDGMPAQEQSVTLAPSGSSKVQFTFKGE
jgi:plastocyanin